MERLPRELVLDILSRLPTSSLLNVKFVCRSWHNLAQDPLLIDLHLTRNADNNPCLILQGGHPIQNQLYTLHFYPHSNNNNNNVGIVKKIDVPSTLPEFEISCSCNGWLCLSSSSQDNSTVYLYNPFTRNFMTLPNSTNNMGIWRVLGFGFCSATNVYKVLKISYGTGNHARGHRICGFISRSTVQILNVGSSTWRSLGDIFCCPIQSPSQITVNGRLHWIIRSTQRPRCPRIISFDLESEKFREVLNPNYPGFERHGYRNHKLKLVVIKGCLSVVCNLDYGSVEVWIMKEYGVQESWTKEFSISSHLPKELDQQGIDPEFKISKLYRRSFTRVICSLKNGEILLQYKCRALIAYDPKDGTFKDVTNSGMPNLFEAFHHVGNFDSVGTIIGIH